MGLPSSHSRTSPTLHLLLIVVIFGLACAGYLAIIWAGDLRGFSPSKLVAARDLAFFLPIIALFLWLSRRQRYRGDLTLLTAVVFLFAFGLLIQYRLFSDPEYGAAPGERTAARRAKTQATRLLNIRTGYDDDKKRYLFGDPDNVPDRLEAQTPPRESPSLGDLLVSSNTYIPLFALGALIVCFRSSASDRVLLWIQRHALLIGLVTLLPFAAIVLLFSEQGKFLGKTTPWEGVKILFLLSFAAILADTYRHLRRTRWGLPPARYLLPFAVIAAMPVVPFFALSDFGQLLVFLGVYVVLYAVSVRKTAQLLYGLAIVAVLFGAFSLGSKANTGFGVPSRVYFRVHQWTHTWQPPAPETWWWKPDFDRYVAARGRAIDPTSAEAMARANEEAWSDKVFQQSQGLFGIHEGGVTGTGLGLGFPETVPISDSDFIYAAIAEETGLIGSLAILIAVGVFAFAGTAISLGAQDMFTKLLAAGVTSFVCLQTLVNIGGVLRVIPMTGITLPFVSHGGWSLITSFAMLGILLGIAHRNSAVKLRGETKELEFVPVR